MRSVYFAAGLVLAVCSASRATPFPVTIDPAQSNVTVTLTATVSGSTTSSSDTSRVGGMAMFKLQPLGAPSNLTLTTYHFELLDTIDLSLVFRVLTIPVGTFTCHSRAAPDNVRIDFPPATPALTPTPVAANASFSYPNVPANNAGLVDYNATGVVCTVLQSQTPPQPCSGILDLAQQGTTYSIWTGTITTSASRVETLVLNINISGPIDPNNPSTGTLSIVGTLRGTSQAVPRRGDVNLDGVIDAADVAEFVNVLFDPAAYGWQKQYAADLNDDDAFDAGDAQMLATCLLGGGCPG